MVQSVEPATSAQVMSAFELGIRLTAISSEPALDPVCPSLFAPALLMSSLSDSLFLSQK